MFERAAVTAVFTIALVSSTVPGISLAGSGKGSSKTYSKSDPLASARDGSTVYEHQVASSRTVRVWGDTAAVTALLWLKGTTAGKPFEYRLWYSDTYVRLASGWRYVFGQASLPLPDAQQPK